MSRFKPSYSGVGSMIRSGFMEAAMAARGEEVKAVAEAIAPYDATDKDGDHYRDHFKVTTTTHGGEKHDRAAATIENDHVAAFAIEFGTGNPTGERTPKHATLRKAIGL